MSTKYDTRQHAVKMGLFYGDRADLYQHGERQANLSEIMAKPGITDLGEIPLSQFDTPLKGVEAFEFKNSKGLMVKMATTHFRNGYYLWLVNPNGMAMEM